MKRKWFQIHLSTAIVMTFVAAGLLCLNMRDLTPDIWKNLSYGWPFEAVIDIRFYSYFGPPQFEDPNPFGLKINTTKLIADVTIAISACVATFMVMEHFIRRREAHKP